MDIEKLIERLRRYSEPLISYKLDSDFAAAVEEAATALSTLQAENEKLRDELEQVKQERDEAVQCIRGIAKSGRVWMCPYCVHAKDTTGGIAECELDVGVCMMPYSKFEWRGPQKED